MCSNKDPTQPKKTKQNKKCVTVLYTCKLYNIVHQLYFNKNCFNKRKKFCPHEPYILEGNADNKISKKNIYHRLDSSKEKGGKLNREGR